jgi:hypothetical protein
LAAERNRHIQFKGDQWDLLHREHYTAAAVANSGDRQLKYKAWKAQSSLALGSSARTELNPPLEDSTKIRIRKGAHSAQQHSGMQRLQTIPSGLLGRDDYSRFEPSEEGHCTQGT